MVKVIILIGSLPSSLTNSEVEIASDTMGTVEKAIEPEMEIYTTTPSITTTPTSTAVSPTVTATIDELTEQNDNLKLHMETLENELTTLR